MHRSEYIIRCYQALDPSLQHQIPDASTFAFMHSYFEKHSKCPSLYEILLNNYSQHRSWIDVYFATTPWDHLLGIFRHILCTLKRAPTQNILFMTIAYMGTHEYRYPSWDELIIFYSNFVNMVRHRPVSHTCKLELIKTCTRLVSGTEVDPCTICLEDFKVGETILSLPSCGHVFHFPPTDVASSSSNDCSVNKWFDTNDTCPNCRAQVTFESKTNCSKLLSSAESQR
jgi:hypothetical protein